MLYLSLVANLGLLTGLLVFFFRARRRIIDEKVATFGGCIAAIALGLLRNERENVSECIVVGLHRMRGGLNAEDIKYHLVRAAACRLARDDLAFDLIGELAHLSAPLIYPDTAKYEAITNYIHDADFGRGEPKDVFDARDLLLAELHEEKALLAMYRASIGKPNPFKNALPHT